MERKYNEIIELHPATAKWLRDNNFIYDYEFWIDEHNRPDFIATFSGDLHNCKNFSVICEVGNHFNNEEELIDKILQCVRYKNVSGLELYLFLPDSYHEHDKLLKFLCDYFHITIKRITNNDFITNYNDFIHEIYPDYDTMNFSSDDDFLFHKQLFDRF
jgi:hypothetical protein